VNVTHFGINRDYRRSLGKAVSHEELQTKISKGIDVFFVNTGAADYDHTEITAELIKDILENIAPYVDPALLKESGNRSGYRNDAFFSGCLNTILYLNIDDAIEADIRKELSNLESHGYQLLGEVSQDEALSVSYGVIEDDAITDFIVYGNPFSGNPEAGSVMVSEDGKTWYNLAGSLHYDSNTQWNVDVSYIKIAAANTTIAGSNNSQTFSTAGIYYSTNYVPTTSTTASVVNDAIAAATWTSITTATGWWPEYGSAEYYGNVWNDGHVGDTSDSKTAGDVFWNQSGATEVVTYRGVTRVKDDAELSLSGANATNYYRFGYADVRQAGSNYGTAVNPYASLPASAVGGDGFDLAWAVDSSGKPVDMSAKHIRYIRVYSAVLYNAGIFGETSTEVCGLYIASGSGTTTITAPTSISVSATSGTPSTQSSTNKGYQNVRLAGASTAYITVNSSSSYIFVNGEAVTSGNEKAIALTQTITPVQIITQNGNESPYVTVYLIKNT